MKQNNKKQNTIETMIDVAGYFVDVIIQLIVFIPRVAIRFVQGLFS